MLEVLTVAIPVHVAAELRQIAAREFRRPRDQASVLLIEAVGRARAERAGEADTSPIEAREPESVDDRTTEARLEPERAPTG